MSGLHDVLVAEREAAERGQQGPISVNKLAPGVHITDTVIDRDAEAEPGEKFDETAADTINGASSRGVNRGMGKPTGGMSSVEERHNGHQQYRKHSPKFHYSKPKPPEVLE